MVFEEMGSEMVSLSNLGIGNICILNVKSEEPMELGIYWEKYQ